MPHHRARMALSARLISRISGCERRHRAFTSPALTIGGWLQGEAMLDASRPFMDSAVVTLPYLKGAASAAP